MLHLVYETRMGEMVRWTIEQNNFVVCIALIYQMDFTCSAADLSEALLNISEHSVRQLPWRTELLAQYAASLVEDLCFQQSSMYYCPVSTLYPLPDLSPLHWPLSATIPNHLCYTTYSLGLCFHKCYSVLFQTCMSYVFVTLVERFTSTLWRHLLQSCQDIYFSRIHQ
jgi:hypothetical protein